MLFEGLLVSVRRPDRPTAEVVQLLTEALTAAAAARCGTGG
ncbi:hypothetical protein ACFQ2K_12030 [Streptomyces sanglieri]|uniref:TetR family transcriptional regulator n=1 Tax=Streptomyces sanglieri TaxID=193460 RepID=A0ABW2WQB1_9ACTN